LADIADLCVTKTLKPSRAGTVDIDVLPYHNKKYVFRFDPAPAG
jgi:hypothetical protein